MDRGPRIRHAEKGFDMKPKHTPGPWRVGSWYDGRLPIVVADLADRSIIAELTGAKRAHEANAHLIAAAPDLLEALEGAQKALRKALPFLPADSESIFCGEWLDEINAAIAKAKGERP
jgi:hypothetical protein